MRETWQSGYSEIRTDILREFLKHCDRSNLLKAFTPTDVLYADYDLWCNEIIKGLDERLLYTDDEFESAVLDLLDDAAYIDTNENDERCFCIDIRTLRDRIWKRT